jgi:CHAD domain-containing protein
VAKQLSRIVAREYAKTLEEIGNNSRLTPSEAVHEARKSVKKIRAVVRLVRADLGDDYRIQNQELKTIAHQLSSLRDVDVTAQTMESVRDRYPQLVVPRIFNAVRQGLRSGKRGTIARLHPDDLLLRLSRRLRRLARAAPEPMSHIRGFTLIRAGMRRAYRRARSAMAEAHAAPEDLLFHAWRRRVKDHWYHVRLFEGLNVHARARARELKRLETWLGRDHDLVVLRTTILAAPARFGDARTTTIVLGCLARYQTALRRRALKLGGRMFAGHPRGFQRSIDGWWRRTQMRS